MHKDYEMDAVERFWIGPETPENTVIYKMQCGGTEREWLMAKDGTELDPNYSDFSVRVHDPSAKSLCFINRTIAILPKSRLRAIYKLIGEYLNVYDTQECDK